MATTSNPSRTMSGEQTAAMLAREEVVLRERVKGKSFYAIGREHRIPNPERVFRRAVHRRETDSLLRAEALFLEEERLDRLQEGLWDKALSGDSRAVEVALKLSERRSRLLGLDFQDLISGRMVELEEARVRLVAVALVAALEAGGLTPDQRDAVTARFLAELRNEERPLELAVGPEDTGEDLL